MTQTGVYLLTTLPSGTQTADGFDFERIQSKSEGLAECYKSMIPTQLKFESLDSLMTLSDDLVRIDSSVGTVVRRLCNTWVDVNKEIQFNDKWNETDLTQFRWDEKKYPFTETAKVLTNRIYKDIQQIEVRLRDLVSKYQTTSRELAIEHKKETGTLLTRRLDSCVPDDVIVDTEYLMTVFVVISKQQHKEFLKIYDTLNEFVVCDSAIQVIVDNDFELYRVVIFRHALDDFKNECRTYHYSVREFKREVANIESAKSSLEESLESQKTTLIRYCEANFAHVLHAWFHMKILRLFTDSVLHYGLPTKYDLIVMRLKKRENKKLMKNLVGKRPTIGTEVNYLPTREDLGYDPEGADSTFPFVFTSVDIGYLVNPLLLVSR
ncbi:vacuolar ATP synthase subunit C, putative [Entamoeba nuttalli P19]|uniref:V-type proton ATPase subunit C n=1 Tax=Entamoeba nuttalli (strain P19) TaxID=1076696 RepID=K2HX03_ENTNP|nr:vacuolar ATP synthase subunit C, putative [Entamoeba nuttalli P19]EKE40840.1 vacuolar ATP synthase subunit C, putative [Entamoeba nuttalli P19]|eukprot:XP_008856821.1 vacuolar ATP synthase subunit C, putative [Entamoeba nuttalli P19]